MKYRRLTMEELEALESDFIQFLAANSISGADWEKMKTEEPEQAESLVEKFSDVVLQKVLERIEFVELRTSKDWKVFKCGKEKIQLVGISTAEDSTLDFTQIKMLNELADSDSEVYTAEKEYAEEREIEVFNMLNNGCGIADGKLFGILEELATGE